MNRVALKKNFRIFKIADLTIRVESDLPIKDDTFLTKFKQFETDSPGEDNILITASNRSAMKLPVTSCISKKMLL